MIQTSPATQDASTRCQPRLAIDRNADEAALDDRGLCPLWYVRRRLDEELDRARRAGHRLSVVTLGPTGDVSQAVLAAAAATLKTSVRASDVAGWLDDTAIVVVLPDGDESGARHAAQRWSSQIWLKTMHLGSVKWEAFVVNAVSTYSTADEVLDVGWRGLRTLLAPRRW